MAGRVRTQCKFRAVTERGIGRRLDSGRQEGKEGKAGERDREVWGAFGPPWGKKKKKRGEGEVGSKIPEETKKRPSNILGSKGTSQKHGERSKITNGQAARGVRCNKKPKKKPSN